MLFKNIYANQLSSAVGNNMENKEDDVTRVKRELKSKGYYPSKIENGVIDRDTDTGIKAFQRDNDLKEDGIMHPGGETEQTLFKSKNEQKKPITISAVASPFIIAMASFLGVSTAVAAQIWQNMSESERKRVLAQMKNDSDTATGVSEDHKEICDQIHDDDHKRCSRLVKRKSAAAASRCHASANDRYEKCLLGKPQSEWPELITE